MGSRLPPELHVVHGTRAKHKDMLLPDDIKDRVPTCEWIDDFEKWDKVKFQEEMSDFLWETYGIGCKQDRHILGAIAYNMDVFVQCARGMAKTEVLTHFNGGQNVGVNPLFLAGDRAMARVQSLMGELGLTPKSRLAGGKKQEGGKYASLLSGPPISKTK